MEVGFIETNVIKIGVIGLMEEIENLLKSRKINFKKLLEYGFTKKENKYEYKTILIENELYIYVTLSTNGKLDAKVIDLLSNDEYFLVKVADATGEYVGKVREIYKEKLSEIIIQCSEIENFKSNQAKQIIKYIKEKYNNDPEFLWKKFDGTAVFRHRDNKKWYGILITIPKSKLGIDSEEVVDIIDLKISPEDIEKLVDNKKYFLGYHMNKKHWLTIILDDGVEIEKIFEFIDISYNIKK